MKERPIIISTQLIPPTLDGRKTMTRRPLKWQRNYWRFADYKTDLGYSASKNHFWAGFYLGPDSQSPGYFKCPYGQPGDRLWVRETFVIEDDYEYIDGSHTPLIDRPIKTLKDTEGCEYHLIPHYRATEPEPNIIPHDLDDPFDDRTRWTSPRFMPRWASRITLEIVNVRVERLQEITGCDCVKEGMESQLREHDAKTDLVNSFHSYWNSLYTKKPELQWEANPWVWVIIFRRREVPK